MITPQQKAFFDTFGYLALPGILAQDIGWIIDHFEAVWRARPDIVHDGSQRTIFPEIFISADERLSTLVEDPRIVDICTSLLGDGYTLAGGDGNYYSGDTSWHSDVMDGTWDSKSRVRHLKIAFYLDHVTRDTGALRVIPGSHLHGDAYSRMLNEQVWNPERDLGVGQRDLPCVALDSVPGDLVLFDHRTKHAAYGGGNRRRMFTTNWFAPTPTAEDREIAKQVIRWYWDKENVRAPFRAGWVESSPPERQRRCRNNIELFAEVAAEKTALTESAREPALAR